MNIYEISFSPTGGTKKVADTIVNELQGDVVSVDLTDPLVDFQDVSLSADDVAVIAVPSYGGRMPGTAVERLSKIQGNNALAVLVCVYGNRDYEDTLVELQDTSEKTGFKVVAAVSSIAEHSIVRKIAAGRPDDEDISQLTGFAKSIKEKISSDNIMEPKIPGNRPYKNSGGTKMVPKPNKNCVQCGLCAEKCPVQAIDNNDAKMVDDNACISCMRCIYLCPHSARGLNKDALAGISAMLKKVCAEHRKSELFL